jgi:hypothetical protein
VEEEKINNDSVSSGERTRNSPNQCCYGNTGVIGLQSGLINYSGIGLERPIKEGDNPVHDIVYIPSSILSTAGSETPCRNLPAPSGKAKYSQETDSELVLWRKGEKNREQRSEIEPETMRLQAVGALKWGDGVPFV